MSSFDLLSDWLLTKVLTFYEILNITPWGPFSFLKLIAANIAIGLAAAYALKQWAPVVYPNHRSSHTAPTPTLGGLIFIIGPIALASPWLIQAATPLQLLSCAMIVVVSLWDDVRPLSYRVRLGAQVIGLIGLLYPHLIAETWSGGWISIHLSPWGALVWQVVLGLFVLNATNFFDGLNGLLASVSLIGLTMMVFLEMGIPQTAEQMTYLKMLVIFGGSVGIQLGLFYGLNRRGRLFMGDVGSIFLGLVYFIIATRATLEPLAATISFSPFFVYFAPLVFVYFDVLFSLLRRLIQSRPLAEPARDFFFHRLNILGWSHRAIRRLYLALTLGMAGLTIVYVQGGISLGHATILYLTAQGALIAYIMMREHRARPT